MVIAVPDGPTRWTTEPGADPPPPRMNPEPSSADPPASWTAAARTPTLDTRPVLRSISRIEPVVAPLLASPPHSRTAEPKTSATARVRADGSLVSDRANRIPIVPAEAAGTIAEGTAGETDAGVSSVVAAGVLAPGESEGETCPQAASAIATPSAPARRRAPAQLEVLSSGRRMPNRPPQRVIPGPYSTVGIETVFAGLHLGFRLTFQPCPRRKLCGDRALGTGGIARRRFAASRGVDRPDRTPASVRPFPGPDASALRRACEGKGGRGRDETGRARRRDVGAREGG